MLSNHISTPSPLNEIFTIKLNSLKVSKRHVYVSSAGVLDTKTWLAYTHRRYTHLHKWPTISIAAHRRIWWVDTENIVAAAKRFWHIWVSSVHRAEDKSRIPTERSRWVMNDCWPVDVLLFDVILHDVRIVMAEILELILESVKTFRSNCQWPSGLH